MQPSENEASASWFPRQLRLLVTQPRSLVTSEEPRLGAPNAQQVTNPFHAASQGLSPLQGPEKGEIEYAAA